MLLLSPSLPDLQRKDEYHHRLRGNKSLQQKQRFVGRFTHKWPVAVDGTSDLDHTKNADSRSGLARPKPERGPHQEGRAKKRPRIASHLRVKQRAENDAPCEYHQPKQAQALKNLSLRPFQARVRTPQKQKRGKNQRPSGVSEPPSAPDDAVLLPLRKASQSKASNAKGGGDRGTQNPGIESEPQNVPRFLKGVAAVGKTGHKIRSQQRLQRVPQGDPQRRKRCAGSGEVNEKCSHENRGPEALPENEQRGNSYARGGPKRTRARMN